MGNQKAWQFFLLLYSLYCSGLEPIPQNLWSMLRGTLNTAPIQLSEENADMYTSFFSGKQIHIYQGCKETVTNFHKHPVLKNRLRIDAAKAIPPHCWGGRCWLRHWTSKQHQGWPEISNTSLSYIIHRVPLPKSLSATDLSTYKHITFFNVCFPSSNGDLALFRPILQLSKIR